MREERSFTFFLEDAAGTAQTFEFLVCPDEQAAREHAQALLKDRSRYRAIEVFEDDDHRFRLERPSA